MGEVNGTIDAMEKIEVYPPGRVNGDIHAPMITIDSGATFNGNCGMKARESAIARIADRDRNPAEPEKAG
jgi:cytoskeletal protein CcmA (bactofilin family)